MGAWGPDPPDSPWPDPLDPPWPAAGTGRTVLVGRGCGMAAMGKWEIMNISKYFFFIYMLIINYIKQMFYLIHLYF